MPDRRPSELNRPLALLVAGTFFMENLDGTIIATAARQRRRTVRGQLHLAVMATPRSIRFEPRVLAQLNRYAARHPGTSASATAARFVDERLRMEEHPGIIFGDGPSLSEPSLIDVIIENTGLSISQIRTALAYHGAYPDEVDDFVAEADRIEEEALAASTRTRQLLAG